MNEQRLTLNKIKAKKILFDLNVEKIVVLCLSYGTFKIPLSIKIDIFTNT